MAQMSKLDGLSDLQTSAKQSSENEKDILLCDPPSKAMFALWEEVLHF